jgi:hypothetical protein
MNSINKTMLAAAATSILSMATAVQAGSEATSPKAVSNVVLVHGAFVDGSGWRGVYDYLTARGYKVTIVQNPLSSLADDVIGTAEYPYLWEGKFPEEMRHETAPSDTSLTRSGSRQQLRSLGRRRYDAHSVGKRPA